MSLMKLHAEKEYLSSDFEIFGVDPPQLVEMHKIETVRSEHSTDFCKLT
jgi:predicted nucleotidyltransferase